MPSLAQGVCHAQPRCATGGARARDATRGSFHAEILVAFKVLSWHARHKGRRAGGVLQQRVRRAWAGRARPGGRLPPFSMLSALIFILYIQQMTVSLLYSRSGDLPGCRAGAAGGHPGLV